MAEQGRGGRTIRARAALRMLAAGAAFLAATPLLAHDFWIEPDAFRPSSGAVVGVHLKVGQNLDGDLVPRANHLIERFVAIAETGETPIVGPDAGEPAGRFKAGTPGPVVIGYRSLTTPVELEAAKFEAYLAEEGLETVLKARAARGESAKPGKEIYSRCAKSLIEVVPGSSGGAPAPAPSASPAKKAAAGKSVPLYARPLGFTLEIVPLTDPDAVRPGVSLPVKILHEGRPIADVLVVAMNAEDPSNRIKARTDKAGRASLKLDRAGLWLVKAVYMRPAPKESGADWESLWASLTFAVLP